MKKINIDELQKFVQEGIEYVLHNCDPESYAGYLKYSLECYLGPKYMVQVEWSSSVRINIQNESIELEFTMPLHS